MIQKKVIMLLLDFRLTWNSKEENITDCSGSWYWAIQTEDNDVVTHADL